MPHQGDPLFVKRGVMESKRWRCVYAVAAFVLAGWVGFAQGHGRGHDKDKHASDQEFRYSDRDHEAVRAWYNDHRNGLPPGLAKRDELPPGLERQLRVRGTLPPGLRKKIQPCPLALERRLPPPPPDCAHVIIGGHIALLNRRTFVVLDIIHLER